MRFLVRITEQPNGTWQWRVDEDDVNFDYVDHGVGSTEADAKNLATKAARAYLDAFKAAQKRKNYDYPLELA
jgi:hypothetical protein